jgi:hypothetical protein
VVTKTSEEGEIPVDITGRTLVLSVSLPVVFVELASIEYAETNGAVVRVEAFWVPENDELVVEV